MIETYGYDANGNRTTWTRGAESGTATHDAQDRLLTAGPLAYTYTANGELLTKTQGAATATFTYDAFSNLRTVVLPDGLTIEYLVDGRNRRIGKKVGGTLTQRFLYLGGLSPIAELNATGLVTTQYLYGSGGNVPDAFLRGGMLYRVFTDELNSVRFVLDATTGTVFQRMEYDAFGRVVLDTNPGFQPFGFAGGLYDPQTGLVRFGARDYDPEVGAKVGGWLGRALRGCRISKGSEFVLPGLGKAEARALARGMGLPEAQGRTTHSETWFTSIRNRGRDGGASRSRSRKGALARASRSWRSCAARRRQVDIRRALG